MGKETLCNKSYAFNKAMLPYQGLVSDAGLLDLRSLKHFSPALLHVRIRTQASRRRDT